MIGAGVHLVRAAEPGRAQRGRVRRVAGHVEQAVEPCLGSRRLGGADQHDLAVAGAQSPAQLERGGAIPGDDRVPGRPGGLQAAQLLAQQLAQRLDRGQDRGAGREEAGDLKRDRERARAVQRRLEHEQLHVGEQDVRPGAAQLQHFPLRGEHVRVEAEVSEYERYSRAPEHNQPAD